MKMIRHKWFLIICIFVIGLIIGIAVGYFFSFVHYGSLVAKMARIGTDACIGREDNESSNSFQKDPPAIAIYAQDRFINYLNDIKGYKFVDRDSAMLILEVKKNILYEEMGDNQKAIECFNNASKIVRESYKNLNPDSLINKMKQELIKIRKP